MSDFWKGTPVERDGLHEQIDALRTALAAAEADAAQRELLAARAREEVEKYLNGVIWKERERALAAEARAPVEPVGWEPASRASIGYVVLIKGYPNLTDGLYAVTGVDDEDAVGRRLTVTDSAGNEWFPYNECVVGCYAPLPASPPHTQEKP